MACAIARRAEEMNPTVEKKRGGGRGGAQEGVNEGERVRVYCPKTRSRIDE